MARLAKCSFSLSVGYALYRCSYNHILSTLTLSLGRLPRRLRLSVDEDEGERGAELPPRIPFGDDDEDDVDDGDADSEAGRDEMRIGEWFSCCC